MPETRLYPPKRPPDWFPRLGPFASVEKNWAAGAGATSLAASSERSGTTERLVRDLGVWLEARLDPRLDVRGTCARESGSTDVRVFWAVREACFKRSAQPFGGYGRLG